LQLSDGIGVTKDPVWMMILNVKFENRDGPTPGTSIAGWRGSIAGSECCTESLENGACVRM
jgi:hypothetical protein